MAKSKDRTLNPAAAQLKLDKQKALKKGKAAVQAQRISRLAARNPKGLERQIADLQALPSPNARDKKNLEDAEQQLARMRRAKEIVGDGPDNNQNDRAHRDRASREQGGGGGGGGGTVLGKRTGREWEGAEGRRGTKARGVNGREGEYAGSDSGGDTDASVRAIPMPRDTPPPIPHPARIRNHPHPRPNHAFNPGNQTTSNLTNANLEPVSSARGLDSRPLSQPGLEPTATPAAPAAAVGPPPKMVYEAKPMVRDLRKEAVNKFMPEAVRRRKMVNPAEGGGGTMATAAAAASTTETESEAGYFEASTPVSPRALQSTSPPPPSPTFPLSHPLPPPPSKQEHKEHHNLSDPQSPTLAAAAAGASSESPPRTTETTTITTTTVPIKTTQKLPLSLLYSQYSDDDDDDDDDEQEEEVEQQKETPNPHPHPHSDPNSTTPDSTPGRVQVHKQEQEQEPSQKEKEKVKEEETTRFRTEIILPNTNNNNSNEKKKTRYQVQIEDGDGDD